MKMRAAAALGLAVIGLAFLFLAGCAGGGGGGLGKGRPEFADPAFARTPPPVAMPQTGGGNTVQNADGNASAVIDLSFVNEGYVSAQCEAAVEVRFQIKNGDAVYNYQLPGDGTVQYFPMAMGNGNYNFTIFVQNTGTEYFYFLEAQANVQMADEKAPFLLPNEIVNYTPSSQAVSFSYELSQHATSDMEVIQQVYYWITNNISYDTAKVEYVQTDTSYIPNVDEVLQSKKGICYDYAALAAAMLRANGIPCQLIMGSASTPDGQTVAHAWNMVWTAETGWIAVKIEAKAGDWNRVDTTFAASQNADIQEFIGDGNNYVQMSIH